MRGCGGWTIFVSFFLWPKILTKLFFKAWISFLATISREKKMNIIFAKNFLQWRLYVVLRKQQKITDFNISKKFFWLDKTWTQFSTGFCFGISDFKRTFWGLICKGYYKQFFKSTMTLRTKWWVWRNIKKGLDKSWYFLGWEKKLLDSVHISLLNVIRADIRSVAIQYAKLRVAIS